MGPNAEGMMGGESANQPFPSLSSSFPLLFLPRFPSPTACDLWDANLPKAGASLRVAANLPPLSGRIVGLVAPCGTPGA